jgi:GAF domain-containing protein
VQLVDDVEQFDGHIGCSSSTRSELVIPIMDKAGVLRAVLDIDSDQRAFFTAEDAEILADLIAELLAPSYGLDGQ